MYIIILYIYIIFKIFFILLKFIFFILTNTYIIPFNNPTPIATKNTANKSFNFVFLPSDFIKYAIKIVSTIVIGLTNWYNITEFEDNKFPKYTV